MSIEKLNLKVQPNSRARSSDFNKVTSKVDEIIDNLGGGSMSATQVQWIERKMMEESSSEALNKFSLSTTVIGTSTFYSDTTKPQDMKSTVRVTLTYDGSIVMADEVPAGWTYESGSYKREFSYGSAANQAEFKYTIPSTNITVSRLSEYKAVTVVDPAWYGFVDDTDESMVEQFLSEGSLTRLTNNYSGTKSLINTTGSVAHLLIVSKGNSTATQLGSSVLSTYKSVPQDTTSPNNQSIKLFGYKAYYSSNSIAAGGSLDNVVLNIKL